MRPRLEPQDGREGSTTPMHRPDRGDREGAWMMGSTTASGTPPHMEDRGDAGSAPAATGTPQQRHGLFNQFLRWLGAQKNGGEAGSQN